MRWDEASLPVLLIGGFAVLVAGCAETADTFCPVYTDLMVRVDRGELTKERAGVMLEQHLNRCTKCQAREATSLLFRNVQTGLCLYHEDIGHYPSEEEGGLKALWIKPNFSDEKVAAKWGGPYLEKEPPDGWANKVHYQPPGAPGTPEYGTPYKLWSGPVRLKIDPSESAPGERVGPDSKGGGIAMRWDEGSLPVILIGTLAVAVILLLALLPGAVARRRGHPNATAVSICGFIGAFFFPAWIVAIVWAYTGPAQAAGEPEADYHLGTPHPPGPTQAMKSDVPRALSRRERRR
jgi:hypothetical protein